MEPMTGIVKRQATVGRANLREGEFVFYKIKHVARNKKGFLNFYATMNTQPAVREGGASREGGESSRLSV